MAVPSDTKENFSRVRLCRLARVERGKHKRWLDAGLLREKQRYGRADVLRAALLDELNRALRPQAARSVWLAVRDEIGIPGARLELLVDLATLRAELIRSDAELLALLPRGEQIMVLDLGARVREVDARVREHLAALPSGTHAAPAVPSEGESDSATGIE